MKLAYLTSMYPRATDTFIRREVIELRRMGHSVRTFSIRRPGEEHMVSAEVTEERAGTTYLLASPARAVAAFARLVLTRPAKAIAGARLAWKTRPPGLKALLLQGAYLVEAALLAEQLRSSGVEHLHNHIGENSASVAMLASAISGIDYSMTIHGPGIFNAPQHWALGEKIVRSKFTACISDYCRSQCMIWTPHESWSRLHVVRCGVGGEFLGAGRTAVPVARRLVNIGRLCEAKGQMMLVEAAGLLAREGLEFELVLVGDGPLRKEIEGIIARQRLGSRVRITGWLGAEGVRQEIIASRALVLPSFAEGLPVVIMEALALGRPVISTYIAAIPELVEHNVSGFLAPPGSIERLAAAMREVLEASSVRLEAMGRAGARRVAELHDARVEAAKLAGLFGARGVNGNASTPSDLRPAADPEPRADDARPGPAPLAASAGARD